MAPVPDEQGRPEPPLAADEATSLVGFLEFQRATVAWKCAGLGEAGLRATVGASSMTLGGLLKHLAHVEDLWCSQRLHSLWEDAATRSRKLIEQAVADGGLEQRAAWVDDWYDVAPTLRWILLHLHREYARHTGHADLLRESVDGLTGE